MVTFPNCKINIGLRILNRRQDGFHNIKTLFYPLPFYDILEIIPSDRLSLHITGIPIEGEKENNLCLKAYHLLKKDFPHLPYYAIYLHKNIPMGAGLGGGSADAAFMLKVINKKAQLHLTTEDLLQYAARLGSDCSFFIIGKPCLATGRGEKVKALTTDPVKNYSLRIVCPSITIHTGKAYQELQPEEEESPLEQLISTPVSSWQGHIINDFEKSVFRQHPFLKEIKAELYAQGAEYASLSGSGSTLYGLFPNDSPSLSFTPSFKEGITKVFSL